MATRRFFYVTQDALIVWTSTGQALTEEASFPASDEGYSLFSAYLDRSPVLRSLMVVDVIEEEFDTDSIPKVSGSDRKNLIERRVKKRFSRTPYRLGAYLGDRRRKSDRYNVVYSAITNDELIDPWIQVMARHKTPLVGVTSVPLISVDLLNEFAKPARNAMIVTQHQGDRLRLVFIKSDRPISARLSKVVHADGQDYSAAVISEISHSRKYLERSRVIDGDEPLDVYFIADGSRVQQVLEDSTPANFEMHIVDARVAHQRLGIEGCYRAGNLEALYLARCIRKQPARRYLLGEHIDYSRMLRMRHWTMGFAVAAALVCSVFTGLLLADALSIRSQSRAIEAQVSQLQETFRREHEEFEPIQADSHEMKLTVDTGDYILRNSLPIEWVMLQVGQVMDGQPDMIIDRLTWELEVDDATNEGNSHRNSRNNDAPVSIPKAVAVTANIRGQIQPHDGNLRHAFEKIDRLAEHLQDHTAFQRVAVAEYPIDTRPAGSVSGEIRRQGSHPEANFGLTLSLRIDDDVSED